MTSRPFRSFGRPVLLLAAAGGLYAATNAAPAQDSGLRSVRVFENNTNGYACFRIPAIVRAPAGKLLAFAEARHNLRARSLP